MPSSVFPETNFPRVVILIDNGVMPADEMMANITRPVEEAMKDIPGTVNIRSATSRGSAEVNVFFDWSTNMPQAELYVLGRLAEIRSTLPVTATTQVHRLTFTAFPIIGISLTSTSRSPTDLWETARYDIYPRFLRIPGVARVSLVGGRIPEFHVVVDPARVKAHQMTLVEVDKALAETNQFTPAGMQEENYQLYLVVVDDRLRTQQDIENAVVGWSGSSPVRIRDIGVVERGPAPAFNRVTADGKEAVLLNVYGQPNCNTVQIARDLQKDLASLKRDLPPGTKLAFFYDQSQFVNEGVRSVWEAIIIGLGLAIVVLFLFLKSGTATFAAASVVPAIVLMTLIPIRELGMSFNLMTLGGIAAAVGLIIDDAIVVVEAIYAKVQAGYSAFEAATLGIKEVRSALVGSTMTPVVVFIPLAFLDGVAGVFFRELALTIVIALLLSLLLAVTWTPIVSSLLMRRARGEGGRTGTGRARSATCDSIVFVLNTKSLAFSSRRLLGICAVRGSGHLVVSQPRHRLFTANGRGRFCDRLLFSPRNEPHRDQPDAHARGADSESSAGSQQLFSPNWRTARTCNCGTQYRRLSREAQAKSNAHHGPGHRRHPREGKRSRARAVVRVSRRT